jgi:hypothetical protein
MSQLFHKVRSQSKITAFNFEANSSRLGKVDILWPESRQEGGSGRIYAHILAGNSIPIRASMRARFQHQRNIHR